MVAEDGRQAEWEEVRHVAVTSGSTSARRLLIDHGVVPESWWQRAQTVRPGRAYLQLLRGRRGFLANVPVGRLDMDVSQVMDANRHYSGGRFPDR